MTTLTDPMSTLASARPRRPSKVDSIRPTYGFDDVSLAPGTGTVEPSQTRKLR